MTAADSSAMPFTGERFTPECVREIWYEHWHRYAFARGLARGKRVLDAACGEGYGSSMLAKVAHDVVGVDIDDAAITHARERYGATTNLRYERRDATALDFRGASFDVVTCFETLEHVEAQEAMLDGFVRLLADDGVLIVSSPDKHTYSEVAGFRNEFHVRELYRDELLALLKPRFADVRLYGQKLLFESAIWSLDDAAGEAETWTQDRARNMLEGRLDYAPLYFIAVCSKRRLPNDLAALSFFGDRDESVYAHYNHEVRKNMAAGRRIAELEAENERLRAAAAKPAAAASDTKRRPWWRRNRSSE